MISLSHDYLHVARIVRLCQTIRVCRTSMKVCLTRTAFYNKIHLKLTRREVLCSRRSSPVLINHIVDIRRKGCGIQLYHSTNCIWKFAFSCIDLFRMVWQSCYLCHVMTHSWQKVDFGMVRHERSKVASNWESSKICELSTAALICSALFENTVSQKWGGPIGPPSRQNPFWHMGIFGGRGPAGT